jgi:hypothetical protein
MQNIMTLQQAKIDKLTADLKQAQTLCKSLQHQLRSTALENDALKRNNLELSLFTRHFADLALAQFSRTETQLRNLSALQDCLQIADNLAHQTKFMSQKAADVKYNRKEVVNDIMMQLVEQERKENLSLQLKVSKLRTKLKNCQC